MKQVAIVWLILGLIGVIALAAWVMPADAQAPQVVVYAVVFYSPTCPHCHQVMTETLPPFQSQYGSQLEILYVDVSQTAGATLFQATIDTLNIPVGRAGLVPTMVVGSTVMVGGSEIPAQLPTLIETGLANGGIDLPPVPELRRAYQASLDNATASAAIQTTYSEKQSWRERFENDRWGNGLAVGILLLLVVGLVMQVGGEIQTLRRHKPTLWLNVRRRRLLLGGLAGLAVMVVASLIFEDSEFSLPMGLALVVAGGLIWVMWHILQAESDARHMEQMLDALIPVVAILGLIVAGYLAYIEVRDDAAVCGAVGDCNTVQQSEYARLFGILPMGVLGIIGYLGIITAWWVSHHAKISLIRFSQMTGFGLALAGVLFSVYLTFLEPFVIGATCAWCLTSALLMLMISLAYSVSGWRAVNVQLGHPPAPPKKSSVL